MFQSCSNGEPSQPTGEAALESSFEATRKPEIPETTNTDSREPEKPLVTDNTIAASYQGEDSTTTITDSSPGSTSAAPGARSESDNQRSGDSRFGVHLGGLSYDEAAPLVRELGNIYVREELFEDSGWHIFKEDKAQESSAFCRKYCIPTDYSDCDCDSGIYYADKHPGTDHVAGIPFYDNSFNLLVTILNYTNSPVEPPAFETTYSTEKEQVYREYLDYLMTGMPGVRYWEIANEVDLPFWAGSPNDYLEMVRISYREIKQRCPECRVGISFYSPVDRLSEKWLAVLKQLSEECDFIDAHLLPTEGMSLEKADTLDLSRWKVLCPDAVLISTETGIPDQKLHPDWGTWGIGGTREKQADDLVKYCTVLFERGYEKIFLFLSDFDFEPVDDDLFEHTGLVTSGLSRKPAFYAYKTMISSVDGFTNVKKVGDGQYRYSFKDGTFVYVLWNEGNLVPGELTGIVEVTSVSGESRKLDSGKLTVPEEPVFVRLVN